jgi:hypothetical protein
MDLNNHIAKNDNNKPFHSNGFAQIAVGNRVGSDGNVSFNQRQQIDRNRRLVYGYNRSVIGSTYGVMRSKPISDDSSKTISTSPKQRSGGDIAIKPIAPRRFNEPPTRGYHPYI